MASKPHLAILGAGPTGLEAALAAAENGFPFTVYEASDEIAGHVRDWGHVRLFTPWSLNVSERMRRVLAAAGHDAPGGDACPTGDEFVDRLLRPVAELPAIADHLRLGVRVRSAGRRGLLKHEDIGGAVRAARPFRLLLGDQGGRQWTEEADVVLDCTGSPVANPIGDGGIPAPGEEKLADRIVHRIPDLAREADAWADRTTLLVGAGHSAQTVLVALSELAASRPKTRVAWLLRGAPPRPVADDALPERARLTGRVAALAADPPAFLELHRGTIDALAEDGERLRVTLRSEEGAREDLHVDRILALTGQVGDDRLYRQLQIHECYATSGPMKLAAALLGQDGAAGGGEDCLAQTSLGADTLKNPEPGFFILGRKSYGRRNDFLLRVGREQVDEVFELLDAQP